MQRGLWQHGRHIVAEHAFGSSANNHLVGEAAGLATIALLAPGLEESEAWLRRALGWLEREAPLQVLPDGANAEQAFAYQLFVLDLLLLVVALLELRERPVPDALRGALARSADALALLVAPGEPDPAYGDADDGRAFLLDGEELRRAPGVAASLASLLGHGGARALAGAPDAASLLLFGEAGRDRFASAEKPPPPGSGVLPDLGLVVLRRDGVRVTFDAGPLGYLSLAAHGHADALGVTLADTGGELVGDPGTGSYFGNPERRAAFRSTRFHATVAVDGADQAEQAGPFLWRDHYRCWPCTSTSRAASSSASTTATAGSPTRCATGARCSCSGAAPRSSTIGSMPTATTTTPRRGRSSRSSSSGTVPTT